MSRRNEPGSRHGWRLLDRLLQAHDRQLQGFLNEGFVVEDRLTFRDLSPDTLRLEGRVRCQNGLFLDVRNSFEVRGLRGRSQARMIKYRYHAGVEGRTNRSIFRYDNSHVYAREGHPDAHHKHQFDHVTWQEQTPPTWVGEAGWPHLSEVIEELRVWWETTGQYLDLAQREDA